MGKSGKFLHLVLGYSPERAGIQAHFWLVVNHFDMCFVDNRFDM